MSKFFSFIIFVKHVEDNTSDSIEKAVKKSTVFQEKMSEFRVDSKNTMTMLDIDEFKGHRCGTVNGIFSATGRTEPAVAAERNKFESATRGTPIHGTAKSRVATVNHMINIFNDGLTWV